MLRWSFYSIIYSNLYFIFYFSFFIFPFISYIVLQFFPLPNFYDLYYLLIFFSSFSYRCYFLLIYFLFICQFSVHQLSKTNLHIIFCVGSTNSQLAVEVYSLIFLRIQKMAVYLGIFHYISKYVAYKNRLHHEIDGKHLVLNQLYYLSHSFSL